MSARGGYALITVLWFLLLLSTFLSVALAPVVVAQRSAENRIQRVRAFWAARACQDLARARFAAGHDVEPFDSISLGGAVWCRSEDLNPAERVNANVGDSAGLERVLGDTDRVAALLDWIDIDDEPRPAGAESAWYRSNNRPLPRNSPIVDVAELRLIRGFEEASLSRLESLFTTSGRRTISANRASATVLSSISTLSTTDITRIVGHRSELGSFDSPEQIIALLELEPTTAQFAEISTRLSFSDDQGTMRFRGQVNAGTRVLESSLLVDFLESDTDLIILGVEVR